MAKRFCDQCGEPLNANSQFCPGCGVSITGSVTDSPNRRFGGGTGSSPQQEQTVPDSSQSPPQQRDVGSVRASSPTLNTRLLGISVGAISGVVVGSLVGIGYPGDLSDSIIIIFVVSGVITGIVLGLILTGAARSQLSLTPEALLLRIFTGGILGSIIGVLIAVIIGLIVQAYRISELGVSFNWIFFYVPAFTFGIGGLIIGLVLGIIISLIPGIVGKASGDIGIGLV